MIPEPLLFEDVTYIACSAFSNLVLPPPPPTSPLFYRFQPPTPISFCCLVALTEWVIMPHLMLPCCYEITLFDVMMLHYFMLCFSCYYLHIVICSI